jgi:hypothetical protein
VGSLRAPVLSPTGCSSLTLGIRSYHSLCLLSLARTSTSTHPHTHPFLLPFLPLLRPSCFFSSFFHSFFFFCLLLLLRLLLLLPSLRPLASVGFGVLLFLVRVALHRCGSPSAGLLPRTGVRNHGADRGWCHSGQRDCELHRLRDDPEPKEEGHQEAELKHTVTPTPTPTPFLGNTHTRGCARHHPVGALSFCWCVCFSCGLFPPPPLLSCLFVFFRGSKESRSEKKESLRTPRTEEDQRRSKKEEEQKEGKPHIDTPILRKAYVHTAVRPGHAQAPTFFFSLGSLCVVFSFHLFARALQLHDHNPPC